MRIVKSEGRTEFQFQVPPNPKGYSEKALDEITRSLKNADSPVNVEFQDRASWSRAKLTYLHSSFLFLFSQFGYEWALDPCTQVIREKIQKPDKNLPNFDVIQLNNSKFIDSSVQANITWHLIIEPKESKGFLIVFSGLKHWNNSIGVWMPLFGCPYEPPKSSNFRTRPLETLKGHLSTLKSFDMGHRLVKDFFGENATKSE